MFETGSAAASAARKLLTFTLDEQAFAIDTATLLEIREWVTPTALPKMPDYMCGVITLRGKPATIIDLSERLGGRRPARAMPAPAKNS